MHNLPDLATIVNFLVLATVLVLLLKKPLQGFLASRSDGIRLNVEESEKLQQEVLTMVKTFETKLAKLDDEIKSLLADARAEGEKQKLIILERAERMSAQIIENAKNSATREITLQKTNLQKELMTKVIEEAMKNLKSKVTEKDHEQFTKTFIEQIGDTHGDVN